jgi:hypothetical protein
MDGVLLVAILLPALVALFSMFLNLSTNEGGTKGIVKEPYVLKSGKTHTAKKSREQYLV